MLTPGSLAEAMAAATQREWVEGPEFDAGMARAQAVEELTQLASKLVGDRYLLDQDHAVLARAENWPDTPPWNMECQICGHKWFRLENNSEAVPCPKCGA